MTISVRAHLIYVPRALAALGVFGSLLLATGSFTFIIFPSLAKILFSVYMAPLGVFEVTNISTGEMVERISELSPRFKARMAGVFYLLTFLTGAFALVVVSGRLVANLIATACYIAVTLLFYDMFKPVNRSLSLLAAFFSLVGCAFGALSSFHLAPSHISPLVFFGFYCLLIGYLILRSTFLPRILGVLMAVGGLGWLTFLSPPLANYLFPYNLAPGIIGEGALTLWLLVIGVNVQRWQEQASAAGASQSG